MKNMALIDKQQLMHTIDSDQKRKIIESYKKRQNKHNRRFRVSNKQTKKLSATSRYTKPIYETLLGYSLNSPFPISSKLMMLAHKIEQLRILEQSEKNRYEIGKLLRDLKPQDSR